MNYIKNKNELEQIIENILLLVKKNKTNFIFLNGELGSGKTFLVKELAKKLGIKEIVKSPSFNYINIYSNLIHIDAYNLKSFSLESFDDYFDNKLVVVEWGELIKNFNQTYINVDIEYLDSDDLRKYNLSVVNHKKNKI